MLYHVSNISGIKVLKPRISSHKKAYVYAVDNIVTGLLFGAPHDDFDFLITTEESKKPVIYECYPDAFELIFKGKSCSVYEVYEEGFLRGMTNWDAELVCENEVPVRSEIFIGDLYCRLTEEAARGNLTIYKYQHSIEYKRIISEHIVDRLIRFDALNRINSDIRFQKYYKKIIEALLSIMDGHLL